MLLEIAETFVATWQNVLPILVLLGSFQLFVLRQPIPRLRRVVVGFGFVLVGLTLFLVGLEKALFPVGKIMAKQLAAPDFVFGTEMAPQSPEWWAYGWIYLFAALIGFAATIAEPALIAVAYKANQVSGGTISQWGLRLAVALGFGLLLVAALAVFAFWQRSQAIEQRNVAATAQVQAEEAKMEADGLKLAFASLSQLEINHELALLLARVPI